MTESRRLLKQTCWVVLAGAGACALASFTDSPAPWWLAIGISCVSRLDQLWCP